MYDDQWPKWLYRPDGTGEIFQRPEDVPAGDWAETPNRFNGADLTKFDGDGDGKPGGSRPGRRKARKEA